MRALGLAAFLLLVAGCATDSAADLGRPSPITLTMTERLVVMHLAATGGLAIDDEMRLSDAIQGLGGAPAALRATIRANPSMAGIVQGRLTGAGLEPDRMAVVSSGEEPAEEALVALRRTRAVSVSCDRAVAPELNLDAAASLLSLSRCVDAGNLAAMVVDPADLTTSPPGQPGDGAAAADAVRAWRARQGSGLPSVTPKPPTPPSTAAGTTTAQAPPTMP
jgi:type IV pilus biogenesis protein CpaD/CtpE